MLCSSSCLQYCSPAQNGLPLWQTTPGTVQWIVRNFIGYRMHVYIKPWLIRSQCPHGAQQEVDALLIASVVKKCVIRHMKQDKRISKRSHRKRPKNKAQRKKNKQNLSVINQDEIWNDMKRHKCKLLLLLRCNIVQIVNTDSNIFALFANNFKLQAYFVFSMNICEHVSDLTD